MTMSRTAHSRARRSGSWRARALKRLGDAMRYHIVRKGLSSPLLEEDLLELFLREFEIDCVFDIGANLGQYASLLRRLGFKGHIISFEPIPSFVAELKAMAKEDGRWFIEPVALDEVEAEASFNVMASDAFSSLRKPSHDETPLFTDMNVVVEQIPLTTARLDRLYDGYKKKLGFERPFLKLDTQGNDVAVCRGAGDRLTEFVGLQSELAITKTYQSQPGYRDVLDYYDSRGFRLTGLVPNTLGHFPDLIEVDCIMYNHRFRVTPRHL